MMREIREKRLRLQGGVMSSDFQNETRPKNRNSISQIYLPTSLKQNNLSSFFHIKNLSEISNEYLIRQEPTIQQEKKCTFSDSNSDNILKNWKIHPRLKQYFPKYKERNLHILKLKIPFVENIVNFDSHLDQVIINKSDPRKNLKKNEKINSNDDDSSNSNILIPKKGNPISVYNLGQNYQFNYTPVISQFIPKISPTKEKKSIDGYFIRKIVSRCKNKYHTNLNTHINSKLNLNEIIPNQQNIIVKRKSPNIIKQNKLTNDQMSHNEKNEQNLKRKSQNLDQFLMAQLTDKNHYSIYRYMKKFSSYREEKLIKKKEGLIPSSSFIFTSRNRKYSELNPSPKKNIAKGISFDLNLKGIHEIVS